MKKSIRDSRQTNSKFGRLVVFYKQNSYISIITHCFVTILFTSLLLRMMLLLIPDVRNKEIELKNIPGVIEVGLFTKHANLYYKAKEDGSFDAIKL
jgi:hypothetical protein